ncbi:MAG: glycoside hydrolase family 13 protein [Clostridiales bacterium]|nr:glycoside hydrolase family 13 protein [Clostridiales bacterium]
MNPATIFHRPMSEYAFALDDTHYIFRLRTGKGEAESVRFYYADRAVMTPKLQFAPLPMEKFRTDRYFDWYEIRLETRFERIAYYFELQNGVETLFYYGDCYEMAGTPTRADYFQLPFNHRADRFAAPAWTRDAVVYNIFPDSFAAGKRLAPNGAPPCRGGTVRGVTENLDYIASLGFNCIYLNPIFAARSYHRYDTLDYYRIDPHMGAEDDLRDLVRRAHALGIRVILDGVFNHVSSDHPFFRDVLEKGRASRYYSCFYALPETPRLPAAGELPGYTCFSYVADMPKTNTADPFLRQYFCDVGANWVRKFDVDGWRLDVANELDDGFLRAFRASVKAAKSDALIVGEVWENAAHYLGGDMLDSAMNYDFRRYCRRFFAEQTVDAETFDTNVSTLLLRYNENALFAQLNLLDSHDVSRFLSLCGGKTERMELAVLLQMTFPGMPCVFYGDEKGLCGESEPEYRRPMAWDASSPLEEVYRRMIALRKTHPALRYGSFHTELACGGVYRYSRVWNGTKITVAMNLGAEPVKAEKRGTLLLKKGENRDIIGAWEYEVWEEQNDGGNDL